MNVFQDEVRMKRLLLSGIMLMLALLVGSVVLLVFQPFGMPQSQALRAHLEGAQEEVLAGAELEFTVFIVNPAGNAMNVSLEHRIVDSAGVVVARRIDDVTVYEQASIGVRMNVPESAGLGPAVIKTGIRYGDRFLMESLDFGIV